MIGAKTLSKSEICIPRPISLDDHHKVNQERWGEFADGKGIGAFTCQRGYSSYKEFKSTTTVSVSNDNSQTVWCKSSTTGDDGETPYEAKFNVGTEHTANSEAVFKSSRNWPRFTGFSFESYNSNHSSNTMYLRRVATCWVNKDGDKIYCASSLDGSGSRGNANQYNYWTYIFMSDSEEAKLQDEGYRFTGFRFQFRSKPGAGSASWKHVYVFNLKMHTNPDMPDGTRVVLPKMMEFSDSGGYQSPTAYGDDQ